MRASGSIRKAGDLIGRTQSTRLPVFAQGGQEAVIGASHQRCKAVGLEPSVTPEFCGPQLGAWRVAVEQSERLRHHAIPIMGMLYKQITRSESMVVLTTDDGMIIETVGDDDFLESAQKVALANGVTWNESAKGTNAIGTAIVEDAPTLVHGSQHYLKVNHFLTCSASPIHGPDGTIVGVLDVTGDQRSYHQHTMALVNMSITMIENNLVRTSLEGGLRIAFHRRPEFLSTLSEAIACTDVNGTVISANKVARDEFGICPRSTQNDMARFFNGLRFGQLVDLATSDNYQPVRLHLADGSAVFASIECRQRAVLGGLNKKVGDTGTGSNRLSESVRAADRRVRAEVDERVKPVARRLSVPTPEEKMTLRALDTGDRALASVLGRVRRIIGRHIPLLITGASGTGKAALARAAHQATGHDIFLSFSSRTFARDADRAVCLDETTLFVRGVDELSAQGQAGLLELLDRADASFGADRPLAFQLICSTRANLHTCVEQNTFREDLFYRINGLSVSLPRLADRSDLGMICERILSAIDSSPNPVSDDVWTLLRESRWPGNIRQLRNLLVSASALAGPGVELRLEHLPEDFARQITPGVDSALSGVPSGDLKTVTGTVIEQVLRDHNGNVSRAARHLGVSRNTIYRYFRRLN